MTKITLIFCFILQLFFCPISFAAKSLPSLECGLSDEVTESDELDNDKIIFLKNTPKFYLHCDSDQVEKGQTIRAVWIALDSKSLESPNYELDESTLEVTHKPTPNQPFTAKFTSIKPANDWPVGSYKVDLYIDGKFLEAINFSVK